MHIIHYYGILKVNIKYDLIIHVRYGWTSRLPGETYYPFVIEQGYMVYINPLSKLPNWPDCAYTAYESISNDSFSYDNWFFLNTRTIIEVMRDTYIS